MSLVISCPRNPRRRCALVARGHPRTRALVVGVLRSTTTMSFDDWFMRIDEETLMVWASLQKLMMPVGSMSVVYRWIAPLAGAAE